MNILAIDTATSACTVALQCGEMRFSRHTIAPRQQSQLLLGLLEELFEEANTGIKSVDLYCVGIGPGSFIGSRLAVSTIKALAFANNKPVLPVSTLKILAQTAYRRHGIEASAACWDARMEQFYCGCYHLEASSMMVVDKIDSLLPANDLTSFIEGRVVVGLPELLSMRDGSPVNHSVSTIQNIVQLYPEAYDALDFASVSDSSEWLLPTNVFPCYLRKPVTS